MALDEKELLDPRHTAVLTMELQRGIVGDLASMPHLRDAVVADSVIPNTARLLAGARAVGARVVHCSAVFRSDWAGSPVNTPFAGASRRGPATGQSRRARGTSAEPRPTAHPPRLVIGSPEVALVPELGPEASDLESSRMHGMAPFIGTNLDPMLRAEGIRTVVATGVCPTSLCPIPTDVYKTKTFFFIAQPVLYPILL